MKVNDLWLTINKPLLTKIVAIKRLKDEYNRTQGPAANNSVVVRIGGQGVKPHVRKNLGLAPIMGGIKVGLGSVSLISLEVVFTDFKYCQFYNLSANA